VISLHSPALPAANALVSFGNQFTTLDSWGQQVGARLVNLDFNGAARFEGAFSHKAFGDAVACRLKGVAHRTTRSSRRLKEADNDFMLLLYIKQGTAIISHANFEGRVNSGSFFLIDGTKPHLLEMEDNFEHIALRLPRTRLIATHRAATALIGKPFDANDGDGSIASTMLDAVVSVSNVSEYAAFTAFDAVIKTLAEGLINSDISAPELGFSGQDRLLSRIMRTLDANCADPNYSSSQLANEMGISRRYLDRLLSTLDSSFGKLILEKRLERCRAQLKDRKMANRSITAVALENGFNDLSHFSRTFRQRYGCSAREMRQSCGVGG
jgi:AraC-like DNA-binding protein